MGKFTAEQVVVQCYFCSATAPAIDKDWIPSFYDEDGEETDGVVCAECQAVHLHFDKEAQVWVTLSKLFCGRQIMEDMSNGQGHCWKDVQANQIPPHARQQIECEIIDGQKDRCNSFQASNGQFYRW